ncbi:Phospholipase/carboxylesterase [Polychaeton citri CBS 116435]|uniref:Acyl-protein thioesterase 1 n=1 Tax=Polychaeton citri CBS 116435 TaxID=1314669 RepID=A0A9P4UR40_9PEZI|nr:Phospholipase/carboxylesterase [Polychaeton citri CBS 116435]
MAGPAALVAPALKRHTSTVIVAHGLGDSGAGWSFLAESFRRRSLFPETKFIFPNAATIPITANMGMSMPGWYDILNFTELLSERSEDEPGILRSQRYFHSLINEEINTHNIPSDRIILGGFSQGGAMSLFSGVTSDKKLGGVFGLSCYMLLQGKLKGLIDQSGGVNNETPVFMGHGDSDPLVLPRWGKATADQLKEWGFKVDLKIYPGLPHSAAPEEIEDLEKWLQERIPELGDDKASKA